MAWYYGVFSCGHEGRVNIIGPGKDRQRKADYQFSGLCEDCYKEYLKEKREKDNAEAAQIAIEMELPELTGSEKQVAWANTLRNKLINNFNDLLELTDKQIRNIQRLYQIEKFNKKNIDTTLDYILGNRKDSRYYIDNRGYINNAIIELIEREIDNVVKTENDIIEEQRLKEIETEALVVPENPITNAIASIKEIDNEIVVMFEKNDDFRKIVKSLGYIWDNGWRKVITKTTGSATERSAELGNKLLSAGFPVRIYDLEAREKAINADYEPEHSNWIYLRSKGDYKGWFAIRWNGMNDKLYNSARKLPGSKYSNGAVMVKTDYYEEIKDYADLYNFKFTNSASDVLEQQRQAFENNITTSEEPKYIEQKYGLEDVLKSSTNILDDLKDD